MRVGDLAAFAHAEHARADRVGDPDRTFGVEADAVGRREPSTSSLLGLSSA